MFVLCYHNTTQYNVTQCALYMQPDMILHANNHTKPEVRKHTHQMVLETTARGIYKETTEVSIMLAGVHMTSADQS